MARTGRCLASAWMILAALAFLATPTQASAQAATVQVLVAQVSTSGAQVDPALQGMARDFKRNGLAFTNYKLVGSHSLSLTDGQAAGVALPSGRAEVKLLGREADGKLKLQVTAGGATQVLSMSQGGELYFGAGNVGDSKLFLLVRR